MSLSAALEDAANLSCRLASGSGSNSDSGGGVGDGPGGSGSDAVVVVDERHDASAPELSRVASTSAAFTQQHDAGSAEAGAAAAGSQSVGEVAAAAEATVDLQDAPAAAAAEPAAAEPAISGGRPPAVARSGKPQDKAADPAPAVAPGPAVKSYAIQQPPQLLTLHLKRFEQVWIQPDASSGMACLKL